MPVITFLKDMVAFVKGRRHRLVERNTVRFCERAAKKAANDAQKKVWLIAAICADEVTAALLSADARRDLSAFRGRVVRKDLKKPHVLAVMRTYLSALLVLSGGGKAQILDAMAMGEGEFIDAWRDVFEYGPDDMALFNRMTGALTAGGGPAVLGVIGEAVLAALFGGGEPSAGELGCLEKCLNDDLAALMRKVVRPSTDQTGKAR